MNSANSMKSSSNNTSKPAPNKKMNVKKFTSTNKTIKPFNTNYDLERSQLRFDI